MIFPVSLTTFTRLKNRDHVITETRPGTVQTVTRKE